MAVYRLNPKSLIFPPPMKADQNGLLAIGGDLSVDRLRLAYRQGIFPWYEEGEPYLWWCPKERFVIFPKEIRISKSMKKFMKKTTWEVKQNTDFAGVIHSCRSLREHREGTWITDEMEKAYCELFLNGFARSIEVYDGASLIGGLYGVDDGRCFFGESMFSRVSNASKMALIYLAKTLEKEHYNLIDCQFPTEHLERMGGRKISYQTYMSYVMPQEKNEGM